MAYSRREVTDGVTIMNKDLYDNLQDGIDELKASYSVLSATVEEKSDESEEPNVGPDVG